MSLECDRAGIFRGIITECGLFEAESGAKAINITASLDETWNPDEKQWEEWRKYEMVAKGAIWVIKKDGTVNTKAVESAMQFAGWGGSLEDAAEGIFGGAATPCQFVVNEEKPNEYHKETQYRIAFLNEYDRTPGAAGNVTPERAKALQTQYGAQFRALAGNAVRNTPPPANRKLKPPTANADKADRLSQPVEKTTPEDIDKLHDKTDEAMADERGEDIPF